MKNLTLVFLSLIISINLFSQEKIKQNLNLSDIMKGNEYIGHQPENMRWSIDGKYIIFEWNPENNPGNSTYLYDLSTKKHFKATASLLKGIVEFDPSQTKFQLCYFIINGAIVQVDKKLKKSSIIYYSNEIIENIQRIPNSENIYFLKNKNLFKYDFTTKNIIQIIDFKQNAITEKTDSSYLEKQQVELFQFIKDQNKKQTWYKENEIKIMDEIPSINIESGQLENIQISPKENFITYRLGFYPIEKPTKIDDYITKSGENEPFDARPKVTHAEPNYKLGIYNRSLKQNYFVNFSTLSDIRKKPLYLNDNSPYHEDRNIIMHQVIFSSDEKYAIVDVRTSDNKDRWLVSINLNSGEVKELEHQHDEAWIGGPGIHEWDTEPGVLGFLNDQQTIYFQSEFSGYSHLYTYNLINQKKIQLTEGKWEVYDVQLSNDGSKFYLTGNKTHPGNRDFYHLNISDKKLVPIFTANGNHEVKVSPDEKSLIVRYSYKNRPWELYIAKNTTNSQLMQITNSQTTEFKNYNWKDPEIIAIKGSDGKDFYARLYQPQNEIKNNATIMFVHGAGYLQNAHQYWSYYCREYMFHNLLLEKGFTVIDIDYRASEGYGRDYRTAIYREMGGRDLEDYIDAKKYLVKTYHLDSSRFGIYGGSYGGFITLMAMLKTPTEFKCGAALRSVTDWAHYNNEYTSNILNYPETDSEAYKKSSPIYYAQNLKGRLLMLHGMVDDNVQFQDVVRLSQRFIEFGKKNWELAIFPVEAHSFKESYSWTDEYRRILEMFEKELIK